MMHPIMETYCGLHSMAPLFAQSHNSIAKRAGSTFRGVEACKYMSIYFGTSCLKWQPSGSMASIDVSMFGEFSVQFRVAGTNDFLTMLQASTPIRMHAHG